MAVSQFAETKVVLSQFAMISKKCSKVVKGQKMATFVEKTFLDTNFRGTLKTPFWHFRKGYEGQTVKKGQKKKYKNTTAWRLWRVLKLTPP